ncbi:MAG: insulinase family protein [Alphaproteobacteria bacterium]|nr:insulinase family protein [Alphaproteobacteria bacterium SS10]
MVRPFFSAMSGRFLVVLSTLVLAIGLVRPAHAGPDIQRVMSPGGIEAWLIEDNSLPIIAMGFNFDAGYSFDPKGKEGLASLSATLLTRGAGEFDEQKFQERLNNRSIILSFDVYSDNLYGSLKTLSPRRDEAFEFLRLALSEPRFEAEALQRAKEQHLSSLQRSQGNGQWVAQRFLSRMLYGDHGYAGERLGTAEGIAAVTKDDMVGYTQRLMTRDTLLVTVVGDITADELADRLDQVFGDLPASRTGPVAVENTVPDRSQVVVIEREVPQTTVSIGQQGIDRADPDWFAASIANYILGGGGFQSRLMKAARVERGLTYGVYSGLRPADAFDVMLMSGSTNHEDAGEFLDVIREEWRVLAEEGPTDDEVERAKGYLIGSFAKRLLSTEGIASVLLAIRESDLGIDYLDQRTSLIEAVSADDVRRVAAELLNPDGLLVSVVGMPEGIEADRTVPLGSDILDALAEEPFGGS